MTRDPEAVERVARIVDPYAFRHGAPTDRHDEIYQAKAREKAETIVSLIASLPPPVEVGEVVGRLREIESDYGKLVEWRQGDPIISFGPAEETRDRIRQAADLILSLSSRVGELEAELRNPFASLTESDWGDPAAIYAASKAAMDERLAAAREAGRLESEARATALSREVEGLREALQGMVTICVRVGPTTREDVDAIHKARAALSPPVDGGER